MMEAFFDLDWQALFSLSTPLLELLIRATVIYLSLVILFRIILKRESGSIGITDLLVIVIVASAAQNGLSGGYTSITDGIILVGTILIWDYLLDWLAYRFPFFQKLVHPREVKLMENGRFLYRNMRRELISEEELRAQMRHHGVENHQEVKVAYIEGDGQISIVPKDRQPVGKGKEKESPHEQS